MRNIDWDNPLSEDDKEWLRARDQYSKIAENEAKFADMNDDHTDEEPANADDYDKWKVPELADEAARREPAVDIAGLSKKADLIAALRTWDAEHPDA